MNIDLGAAMLANTGLFIAGILWIHRSIVQLKQEVTDLKESHKNLKESVVYESVFDTAMRANARELDDMKRQLDRHDRMLSDRT